MTYLVLGATGLQGGAVARALLARTMPVRALSRTPGSAKARALAEAGAEVVAGDLDRPDSLPAAFADVAGVFSVQDFYAPGVGLAGEIRQGRNVIAAARAVGVRHIVQSTMGDGKEIGGPPHFLSKAVLEHDVRDSGLDWTLLGTVWFMDNLMNPAMKPALMFPVLAGSLKPETPFHMLSIDDLGWVAAEALANPSAWAGRKINMAGDVLTVPQMKAVYANVTGRRPKQWRILAVAFRRLVPEFAAQLDWHNRVNFAFDAAPLREVREEATDFRTFLKTHKIAAM